MARKPVNQVVSEALSFYMGEAWNNTSLGKKAGVAANTVANALAPAKRAPSKSGKSPSIKLTELERLADALGVTVVDLVSDLSHEQRQLTVRQRAAEYYLAHGVLPSWAPDAPATTRPGKRTGTNG